MKRHHLYYCGLFAPIIFILNAILGGSLRPGYSHLVNTVSELFTVGSPNRLLLSSFYTLFSIGLILFGIGLLQFVCFTGKDQGIGKWGASLFIVVGILNSLTATVFPQDPWGSPSTFPGEMHMILSGIITLLSLGYMLLFGIWFHRTGIFPGFLWYSIITVVGAFLAGAWFAISVDNPIMGLAERIAILVGFQWTLALSILMIKADADLTHIPEVRPE